MPVRLGDSGARVRALQYAVNARLLGRDPSAAIEVDGVWSRRSKSGALRAAFLIGIWGAPSRWGYAQERILDPGKRTKAEEARGRRRVKAAKAKPSADTLRERAYVAAAGEVGVMESGGNNRGTPYTRYQRANGAIGPEAWCGDFMAWCYRRAGSKSVARAWAAVRLLLPLTGLRRTSSPRRGNLVRFTFDHVGMYVRDLGDGWIETIEGNTGSSGAVSDGDGQEGVYRKRRPKSLVRDYVEVTR